MLTNKPVQIQVNLILVMNHWYEYDWYLWRALYTISSTFCDKCSNDKQLISYYIIIQIGQTLFIILWMF